MSREVYGKLKSTSITSSISSKPTSVESIPFPAVTITAEFYDNPHSSRLSELPVLFGSYFILFFKEYEKLMKAYIKLQPVVEHLICHEKLQLFLIGEVPFNFTSNRAVFEYLKANQTEHKPWFEKRLINWNSRSNAPFAETLTRYGLGFSFNLIQANDLLDFERFEFNK
jgi:hypothetical protein